MYAYVIVLFIIVSRYAIELVYTFKYLFFYYFTIIFRRIYFWILVLMNTLYYYIFLQHESAGLL